MDSTRKKGHSAARKSRPFRAIALTQKTHIRNFIAGVQNPLFCAESGSAGVDKPSQRHKGCLSVNVSTLSQLDVGSGRTRPPEKGGRVPPANNPFC
jgi:hypothetical protein